MIYRISEASFWAEAPLQGFYASPDLAAEGFIHFSERHQVAGVAQRYYRGKEGLMLLQVDEARLGAGTECRRENTTGGRELFPHVYGRVPLTAVLRSAPLRLLEDGSVDWPEGF
jgi:uncharacterized protein (DUF952 family)